MTLRTPRRRISPRAKRKYRVIRNFFRRALGSSSQQDIKINSSIAVNVTDLKHKIVGIEHQLNEVSRHCHEVESLESAFRKETENILSVEHQHELSTVPSQSVATQERSTKPSDTRVLYKPSRKSDESDYVSNTNYNDINERKNMTLPANMGPDFNTHFTKVRKKKSKLERGFAMYEGDPVSETLKKRMQQMPEHYTAAYTNSSYHSMTERGAMPQYQAGDVDNFHRRKHSKRYDYVKPELFNDLRYNDKHKSSNFDTSAKHNEDKQIRIKKKKQSPSRVDQEFIADLIRRQYKPKKLFGRKPSELSQFSAPVCRDQEFSLRENLIESPELCSCCYDDDSHAPRISPRPSAYHRHFTDLSDNRSICDTRLYSTKRAHTRSRRRHVDVYNDSAYYDVVPVKEKSSPKARRKFVEEQARYEYYKEVPPSPRTHRPRLNLKAQQYAECDEYVPNRHVKKMYSSKKHKRKSGESYSAESDSTSEINNIRHNKEKTKVLRPVKLQTSAQIHQEAGTMISLQYPNLANEQAHLSINDTTLNKSQDTDLSDKTDKALCEIKDILQNFLQEIKKEASSSEKIEPKQETQTSSGEKLATGAPLPSAPTFNYAAAPCSVPTGFVPPFTNPCCYPLMPVCPMNCLPNSYVMPSQSCTCHAYATNSGAKEALCPECCKQQDSRDDIPDKSNETEELIKEIYKFVAHNPTSARKRSREDLLRNETGIKVLTSRSVGGTSRMSKHDAKVGTPAKKCYSKSCEAIGSRMITETSYTTATQSDTILEKLSLEATTQSDTEIGTDSTATAKGKQSKFANMLRSIGLLKKKKKPREISETESSMEVDVRPRRSPPFRQEIIDYAVHGQEYFHKPPSPPFPPRRPHESRYDPRHQAYHEPRYDRHEEPGYDTYHDPQYYHHNSRHEDHHEHRRDPHYDSHYDPRHDHHPHHHGFVPPPPGCEHRGPYYTRPPPHSYSPHRVHEQAIPEHVPSNYPHTRHRSPSPPYSRSYDGHYGQDPQVPLCLREIEVKSTGTQSERKMSFFSKLGRRTPPQMSVRNEAPINAAGTQTAPVPTPVSKPVKPQVELAKPALFGGWKKFQEKVITDINEDPAAFGYRTHKNLAEGDKKMRNAMLKKMFYKKNPFSPNNLIIRTLLGNDPSSFGEPAGKLRTRLMF